MLRRFSVAPVLLLVLLAMACGGSSNSPPPGSVSIAISPGSATITEGQTQQFSPTVTGTSDTAVIWSLSDSSGGTTNVGTISSNGLYTAPHALPRDGKVTIKAVSKVSPSASTEAEATILPTGSFTNASLKGNYVFRISQSSDPFLYVVGVMTADGNGNLSGGVVDTVDANSNQPEHLAGLSGTYRVTHDGRGSATLGTMNFDFVLSSGAGGQLIGFDANLIGGTLTLQDQTAASTIGGNYVFELLGGFPGLGGDAYAATISFNPDMSISGGGFGFLSYTRTLTDPHYAVSIAGTYSLDAQVTGRGVATLTFSSPPFSATKNLVFYVMNKNQIELAATDATGAREAGSAFSQLPPFPLALSQSLAFSIQGYFPDGGAAAGQSAVFSVDAAGHVVGTIESFPPSPPHHVTGFFSPLGEGFHVTFVTPELFDTELFTVLASPEKGVAFSPNVCPDAGPHRACPSAGIIIAQKLGPFQASALKGNYVFSLYGATGSSFGIPNGLMGVGQFNADGVTSLSGLWDVSYYNGSSVASTVTGINIKGTYTMNPDGVGNINFISDRLVEPSPLQLFGSDFNLHVNLFMISPDEGFLETSCPLTSLCAQELAGISLWGTVQRQP